MLARILFFLFGGGMERDDGNFCCLCRVFFLEPASIRTPDHIHFDYRPIGRMHENMLIGRNFTWSRFLKRKTWVAFQKYYVLRFFVISFFFALIYHSIIPRNCLCFSFLLRHFEFFVFSILALVKTFLSLASQHSLGFISHIVMNFIRVQFGYFLLVSFCFFVCALIHTIIHNNFSWSDGKMWQNWLEFDERVSKSVIKNSTTTKRKKKQSIEFREGSKEIARILAKERKKERKNVRNEIILVRRLK